MFGWVVKTISADELADRLATANPVVIDVREPTSTPRATSRSAVNIPLGSLGQHLGELDPNAETVLICQSGHRSKTAAGR